MKGEKERQEQATKLTADLLEQFRTLYLYSLREVLYEKHLRDFHLADGASVIKLADSVSLGSPRKSISSPRRHRSSSEGGSAGSISSSIITRHARSHSTTNNTMKDGGSSSNSPRGLRKESSSNTGNSGLRRENSGANTVRGKRKSRVMEAIGNVLNLSSSTPPTHSVVDKLSLPTPATNFSTKVICSQAVEVPSGTYIVYVISSRLGEDHALVFKRFKEFKELHSFLKRNDTTLSPRVRGAKIESSTLRSELIASREQMLCEYLQAAIESNDSKYTKDIQLWLGLGLQKDEILTETFKRAYHRFRSAHSLWKKSIFRTNPDAVYQFICNKIKQEVFTELHNREPLPHREINQYTEEYKACTQNLEAEVEKYFLSLNREAVQLRAEVNSLLEKNIYHVEQLENTAKVNAKKLISEVFKSAWPKFEDDLRLLVKEVKEPLLKTLHKLTHFQILLGSLNVPVNFDEKMKEIFLAATPEKIDSFEKIFLRLKQTVKSHLTIQLAFSLPRITEKLKASSQTDSFHFLDSIQLLPDILSAILDLADPASLFITVRQILDCKYALLQEHPANSKKTEDILDRFELLTQEKIWWSRREVVCNGYAAYYELWEAVGNAGPFADIFKDLIAHIEALYKKVLTKLSHRFGDLVHEAIQKEIRDWKHAIDTALLGAYEAAKKTAFKHLQVIFKKFVVNIIKEGIKPQVQNIVVGPINIFIDAATHAHGMPMDFLDQVKGQDRLHEQVFEELLREHVELLVGNVVGEFHVELDKEFAA